MLGRTFIETDQFRKDWDRLGLDDNDLRLLQSQLTINPDLGDRIPGGHGLRKIRVPLEGRGKRGGARTCYYDHIGHDTIYLLTAYGKNEAEDLTQQQLKTIANNIREIERRSTG